MRINVVHAPDGTVSVAVEDEAGSFSESGTGRSTGPDGMNVPLGGSLEIVITEHGSGAEPDLDLLKLTTPEEEVRCNGKCIGSPNYGVTVPDPDCPKHGVCC